MLSLVQRRLVGLYDVPLDVDVADFLCDVDEAEALGADDAGRRGEVLFVSEGEGGPRVALYVDAAVRRFPAPDFAGDAVSFRAACLGVEGVSHFVYVAFRAEHGGATSELELELQADVDKWALGALGGGEVLDHLVRGHGVGLVRWRDRSRALRARLFDEARFLDAASSERGARYRLATRLAARFTERLERGVFEGGGGRETLARLRRFYRLGGAEKLAAAE